MIGINKIFIIIKNKNGLINIQCKRLSERLMNRCFIKDNNFKEASIQQVLEYQIQLLGREMDENCNLFFDFVTKNNLITKDFFEKYAKYAEKAISINYTNNIQLLYLICINLALFHKQFASGENDGLIQSGNKLKSFKFIINKLLKNIRTDYNINRKHYFMYHYRLEIKIQLFKSLYFLTLLNNEYSLEIDIGGDLKSFLEQYRVFLLYNREFTIIESNLQQKVEVILIELNKAYEKEKKLDLASVDFYCKPNKIIEVNGPKHYYQTLEKQKGKYILKKACFEFEKHEVLDIHYKEICQNIDKVKQTIKDFI